MERSRFSEEQVIGLAKEQEAGMPTAEVCRRHGISPATFHKWKSKFGRMEVSETKRLHIQEDENAKLKKNARRGDAGYRGVKTLRWKKLVTPGAKLGAATHAQEAFGLSERRACSLVGVSRPAARYRSTRPDDAPLRTRLRELAAERRRFGYRSLRYLLARKDMTPNYKKLLRIYREEGLRVRRHGGRKRGWV